MVINLEEDVLQGVKLVEYETHTESTPPFYEINVDTVIDDLEMRTRYCKGEPYFSADFLLHTRMKTRTQQYEISVVGNHLKDFKKILLREQDKIEKVAAYMLSAGPKLKLTERVNTLSRASTIAAIGLNVNLFAGVFVYGKELLTTYGVDSRAVRIGAIAGTLIAGQQIIFKGVRTITKKIQKEYYKTEAKKEVQLLNQTIDQLLSAADMTHTIQKWI